MIDALAFRRGSLSDRTIPRRFRTAKDRIGMFFSTSCVSDTYEMESDKRSGDVACMGAVSLQLLMACRPQSDKTGGAQEKAENAADARGIASHYYAQIAQFKFD